MSSQSISKKQLSVGKSIGKGFFGQVSAGTYKAPDGKKYDVAIKKIPKSTAEEDIQLFHREIECMLAMNIPEVVRFHGSYEGSTHFYLVFELMETDLAKLIAKEALSWADRIDMVISLVKAVSYMHAHSMIHRDIKGENVLVKSVDGKWQAKLADLGLSRVYDPNKTLTIARGTTFWMAPEVIMTNRYGPSADIFSVGMTIAEIIMRRTPDPKDLPRLNSFLVDGSKLDEVFPDDTPADLKEIVRSCCCTEPDKRPTAMELQKRLEALRATL
ncbi:Protein kinase domain [Carpediemonas membranifera]|uniref:Protein kinase domain n=1 Tax=Carpediemonas membranifera TaxID=201153 RepID=A0A8J6B218_9EUKA|nr:Protein kinase domain [Carpediemonas membranifera]|eukprot:KAG9397580.1 Protein kinase domain [Carpediemonas membranifera]